MSQVDDHKYYQGLLNLAKSRMDDYVDIRKHNYALYNSEEAPKSKTISYKTESVNEVYPIVESQKVDIGFRYPKITLKAKRPRFFVRKVHGEREHELMEMASLSPVFQEMLKNKRKRITQQEKGKTVDYIILDGQRSAKIAEKAMNQFIEDKQVETSIIEDALKAAFAIVDFQRVSQGRFPLTPILDQFMTRRGGGGAKCIVQEEDGELKIEITPWDRLEVAYAMGSDGFDFAGLESLRHKNDIMAESWAKALKAEKPDWEAPEKESKVLDLWTPEVNYIYVADEKVFEQENPFGYVPVCFQLVPMGSMITGENSAKFEGESIFFLIRDLIPELNRLVSIIQSLNQKELDNVLQVPKKPGTQEDIPGYEDLDTPATTVEVEQPVKRVELGKLREQAWLLNQMIETRLQRGSLSNFDYGTFTQPMSAVALIQVGEGRDQVFLPRLGSRGLLKQQLGYMLIDQIIKSGMTSVEIGTKGHKRTFQVSKLEGEYDIQYKYFVKSPTIDIARVETAAAAIKTRLSSVRNARRNIAQQEDPEEEERWIAWEDLARMVPAVALRRAIEQTYELAEAGVEGADLDAEIAEEALINMLGQATPEQEPGGNGKIEDKLMSLFGKETAAGPGPAGSSSQRGGQLKRTPIEEE